MCLRILSSTLTGGSRSRRCRRQGSIFHVHCAKVIRVRNEQILFSIGDQLIENTGVQQSVVNISVTRGVPVLLVVVSTIGAWKKSFLEDSWISGLIEGSDAKLLVGILLDNSEGILVGVERSHEDEGNIHLVGGVQMLDLADGQVEEGHVIFDLQGALRAGHSYSSRPQDQTGRADETGNKHEPMEVPSPPLTLRTANLSRRL